ncbi:MAG: CarD family transcriptional regulator [Alphaproteobacteria bacterium]
MKPVGHGLTNGTIKVLGKAQKRNGFSAGDYVVYPTHGVGKITGIEKRDLGGAELRLLVVNFEKDRMTLRVPVNKVETSGMRRLSSRDKMRSAMTVLKGRARVKRTMWSRRAQEYEAKINSGDPESIAEVVRDLHGRVGQPDQSYSERQLYEAALDRLVREIAAVERIDTAKAVEQVNRHLKVA